MIDLWCLVFGSVLVQLFQLSWFSVLGFYVISVTVDKTSDNSFFVTY